MSVPSDILLSVGLGLGLSAACGFRIFVPFLAMSGAAHAGYLQLDGRFEWIGSTPALIVFGVATLLEIGAYYLPWLDNLLDSVASPAAVIAGVVATASVVTDMDPLLKWSLAVIAGGGLAGAVQAVTAAAWPTRWSPRSRRRAPSVCRCSPWSFRWSLSPRSRSSSSSSGGSGAGAAVG